MFGWIPTIFNTFISFGAPYWIGVTIVIGLGVVLAGVIYQVMGPNGEPPEYAAFGTVAMSLALGFLWPLAVIALPFLAVAGGLFYCGICVAKSLGDRI